MTTVKQISEPILTADRITLVFGGVTALNAISFEIRRHEILAMIGPNGAGKTSMLNVINGFYHPQAGTITWKGETRRRMRPYDAAAQGIARTFQNVALFKGIGSAGGALASVSRIASSARIWPLRPSSKVISVSMRPAASPE